MSISQFNEGGKGRKQCSNCKKFVAAVVKKCPCGHVFKKAKKEEVVVQQYDEGGKGRKECPKCHKFVGATTLKCPCSYEFRQKKSTEKSVLHDEGGRGKKQCPSCKKYVGAVSKTCPCGHEFVAGKIERVAPIATRYDEGGRGRKQCPSCKKYVGAKSLVCPCGNNFEENPSVKSSPKFVSQSQTYTTGGRGRKLCPSCKKYVGAKSLACPCGYNFQQPVITPTRVAAKLALVEAPKAPVVVSEPAVIVAEPLVQGNYSRNRGVLVNRILTPKGGCPVKLEATDRDSVLEWIEKVLVSKEDEQTELTPSALKFYAREFYSPSPTRLNPLGCASEYQTICDHIEVCFGLRHAS